MKKDARIYVAGHTTMIGSAFARYFERNGYTNLITRNPGQPDLTDQAAVRDFFRAEKPEYVILAAGKSGGILANQTYPGDFIYNNLQIQNNVIHSSYENGVKKLLFLARSCCYPRECRQPMKEEFLMTGPVEPTSEPFAVAKLAGIKMCQAYNTQYKTEFIPVIPTNIYGPNDDFDLSSGHVLASLMRKMHEAREENRDEVAIWGTGTPRREFLHADDLAAAGVFLLNNYSASGVVNIGYGEDLAIAELAAIVKEVTGFAGRLVFDYTKPDGALRKLLDSSKIRDMGWKPQIGFDQGLKQMYDWFLENYSN